MASDAPGTPGADSGGRGAGAFGIEVPAGDPGSLDHAAGICAGFAEHMLQQAARARATSAVVADAEWIGKSKSAFSEGALSIRMTYTRMAGAGRTAASGYRQLAAALRDVQPLVRMAIADARQADHERQLATLQLRAAEEAAVQARQRVIAAHTRMLAVQASDPLGPSAMTAAADHAHEQSRLYRAEADVRRATTRESVAQDELSAAQRRGQGANGAYELAALRAIGALEAATDELASIATDTPRIHMDCPPGASSALLLGPPGLAAPPRERRHATPRSRPSSRMEQGEHIADRDSTPAGETAKARHPEAVPPTTASSSAPSCGAITAAILWSHTDPGWDDLERESWEQVVVTFAGLLVSSGVDVKLDRWRHEPEDWSRFGSRAIRNSYFILVIVSHGWRLAWNDEGDPSSGAGAVAEADLLRDIYRRDRVDFRRRVILVVLPGVSDDHLPDGLGATNEWVRIPTLDARGVEPLLRLLSGQGEHHQPKLGPPRHLPPKSGTDA
jgi:hypothetical protein